MERQTSLFLIGVALLVCSATVFAQSVLVANFIERKEGDKFSYTTGKVYYKYDGTCATVAAGKPQCLGKTDRAKSRLLFEYDIGLNSVRNFYDYSQGAMFSMCTDSCSGILLLHKADPWFWDENYYSNSSDKEGNMYWYYRTSYGTNSAVSMENEMVTPQVKQILMNKEPWGSDSFKVSKIIFSDNRSISLDNVHFETGLDDKFKVDSNLNCPKATCPIFADLIFVLDNSGSVSGTEWKQTATFVNNVIDTFTFGEDAANAAVIQFNAPSLSCSYGTCSRPKQNCTIYNKNAAFPGRDTASVFCGTKVLTNEATVSGDAASIKSNMTGTRPSCYGNTCQGYGLRLALDVIRRSPRRRYGKRPQPIVIAVTDGVDHCPNSTWMYAEQLRTEFDALVIEVGVGMSTSCNNYDKKFLKNVSSKIGSEDNPAYYDVTDYNAIKALSDKLFKPICDKMDGACGPDCHGFCGCGKCMCPSCDNLNSTCNYTQCRSDGTSSTGCVVVNVTCGKENKCEWYSCDPSKKDDEGRCTKVKNKCEKLRAENPGKCREVYGCDPENPDEPCYLNMNHAYCNSIHNDKCVEYECTPEGELADDNESGCRIKENKTLTMENEFKKMNKWCAVAVCDPETGVTEGTTCQLDGDNPLCYKPVCIGDNAGGFKCHNDYFNRPDDTECFRYTCLEMGKGWQPTEQDNPPESCYPPCKTVEDCNSAMNISNSDPTSCWTAVCNPSGYCSMHMVNLTEDREPDNACKAWQCKKQPTGEWKWEYADTIDAENCLNDTCGFRYCDPHAEAGKACKTINFTCDDPLNVCRKLECVTVEESDKKHYYRYCNETNLLRTTHCMYEECSEDGLSKFWVPNLTVCNKSETFKCLTPHCYLNRSSLVSSCYYTHRDYDDEHSDRDLCLSYTCNNDTGDWETSEKCTDDDLCTEDVCNVFGNCSFPEITCEELSMDAYPCYYRQCIPDPVNNKYMCKRRHIKGAMIDLCGNCIMEKDENQEKGHHSDSVLHDSKFSSEQQSSSSSVDLISCTMAGPRPLLTEGLAAASVALIIIGAVVIGAGIAASGVIGTKTLIERARGANNQSAHTNPLFQENEAEMSNPAFIEEKDA